MSQRWDLTWDLNWKRLSLPLPASFLWLVTQLVHLTASSAPHSPKALSLNTELITIQHDCSQSCSITTPAEKSLPRSKAAQWWEATRAGFCMVRDHGLDKDFHIVIENGGFVDMIVSCHVSKQKIAFTLLSWIWILMMLQLFMERRCGSRIAHWVEEMEVGR